MSDDPFELGKKYDKRNTRNNTRGQNIAAGAAGGVAVNAVGGAALGGAVGAHAARSGLRDLKAVGAAPSKLGAARIVTGHAARTGGKTALGLGTLGLIAGTAHGAMVGARRRKPVRKNARRMDPAPATARFAGALPKHSPEAQAVAQAAATKRTPPVAAAIRGTLRATTIAKAEDPFQPVVKSAFGAPGDKRNTKYAAAGYGGALVGTQAGGRLGARAGGTTLRAVTTANRGHLSGARVSDAEHLRRVGSIPGVRPTVAGLTAGAVLGGAAAAGAVHRHRRQGAVAKSAFEPVAKKKIPAVLIGEKVAPRGFEPRKLPARSVRDAGGRGAQGQRRAVRSGKL